MFTLRKLLRVLAFGALIVVSAVAATPLLTGTQQRVDPQVSAARVQLRSVPTTVAPYMSDAFADSFGVNTRFAGGTYAAQRPTVERFLVDLGFRHIRDGSVRYKPAVRAYLQSLCTRYGIHSSLGLVDTDTDEEITHYIKDVPCVEMVEGPNELNGQPNWVQRVAEIMPRAYALIHNTPAFAGIPVVAPSITKLEDSEGLAQAIDVSRYADIGNKHSYPGNRNIGGVDGTGAHGWGPTHAGCPQYGFGSFFYSICAAQMVTKSRPIWTTETGYSSTPAGLATPHEHPPWGSIPYDVAAKYFPRLMAYEFLNGIPRTYIMALLDGSSGCNGPFNSLGLVEQDCPNTGDADSLHPKPPFSALKNLMATVADPGPAFTTTPLTMKISGGDAKLETLLLQKRSGRYLLLFWVEASDWNVDEGRYQAVKPEPIAISIGGTAKGAHGESFTIDKTGNLTKAETVHFSGDRAEVTATDEVTFLTFDLADRAAR